MAAPVIEQRLAETLQLVPRGVPLAVMMARDAQVLTLLGYTASELADLLTPLYSAVQTADSGVAQAASGHTFQVTKHPASNMHNNVWTHEPMPASAFTLTISSPTHPQITLLGETQSYAQRELFPRTTAIGLAPEEIVDQFGVEKVAGSVALARSRLLPAVPDL